jgi:hypothetical protein
VIAVLKKLKTTCSNSSTSTRKIEVIYNGIDLQQYQKRKIPAQQNMASILLNHLFFCRPYYKTERHHPSNNAIKYTIQKPNRAARYTDTKEIAAEMKQAVHAVQSIARM